MKCHYYFKGVMSVEELLQRLEEFGVKEKPFAPAREEVEGVLAPRYTIADGQHRVRAIRRLNGFNTACNEALRAMGGRPSG